MLLVAFFLSSVVLEPRMLESGVKRRVKDEKMLSLSIFHTSFFIYLLISRLLSIIRSMSWL